jgi:hypothetical protein
MARKIELTVNTCSQCPYCVFESEIGDHFCHADPDPTELSYVDLETWDITKGIPPMCPLPYVKEEKVVDATFSCTALQVQEVNDCPEEWMEQIIAEEEAHDQRMRRETERDVEKLFEGFDENDESWDHQK